MGNLACQICGNLIGGFHFERFADAGPPGKPGVYAIRVAREGADLRRRALRESPRAATPWAPAFVGIAVAQAACFRFRQR